MSWKEAVHEVDGGITAAARDDSVKALLDARSLPSRVPPAKSFLAQASCYSGCGKAIARMATGRRDRRLGSRCLALGLTSIVLLY